jgi:hypothetical protein
LTSFRADLEAQSVSWEVLDKPEEKEAKDMPEHQQRVPQPSTSSNLPPTPTVVQFEEAGLPNSDEEKSDEEFVATITEREAALKSDDFLMDLHLSDSSADDDDATMMMDDGNSRQ